MDSPADNVELIFTDWLDAIRRRDIDRLAGRLAEDVVHRGVRADLICPDRASVIANVSRRMRHVPAVDAVELIGAGDRVVLSIRAPEVGVPVDAGAPQRGRASIVFTIRDGKITEIQDYLSRHEALEAVGALAHESWA